LSRKAQLEMVGIAIVVVLIIIGATVFISLSLKPPSKAHAKFAQKEMAQNIVDTLVKASTNCKGLDFAAVLEECSKSGDAGSLICEDGRRPCMYAREEISGILDKILGLRKLDYQFTAKTDIGSAFDDIETSGCTRELIDSGKVTVETPGIQPIPLYPGTLTLMLRICTPR